MALEDLVGPAKFINDLVASNPEGTDDRSEGDDHMRGIKNVLKNTFPNMDAAVIATDEELNQLSGYDPADGAISDRLDDADAHAGDASIHFEDVTGPGQFVRSQAGWQTLAGDVGDVNDHIADASIHFEDVTTQGVFGRTANGWSAIAGAGDDSLDMNTGGLNDQVDLDLGIYKDSGGGAHIFTNDVLSYNILGSTPGKTIGVKISNSAIVDVAVVGKNGAAHGWVSAAAIENRAGWGGDSYNKSATVQWFERGPDVSITPHKTVNVSKTTTTSEGSAVTEMVTSGLSGEVHLDLKQYVDSGGGANQYFTNDAMIYNILGATPGKTVGVKIGSTIYDLGKVGSNGTAVGWVSALGIQSAMGWSSTNYNYTTTLTFYQRSPDIAIGPSVVARVQRSTNVSEGTPVKSIVWQEYGMGTRQLEIRYVDGFRVDDRKLAFFMIGQTANAAVKVRASNGSEVAIGSTNAQGLATGQIRGAWMLAWGYSPGQSTTASIVVGNVTVGSVSISYFETHG